MKNKNADSESEKYKELIQRMENRKNQANQSPKNQPNFVYSNQRAGYNGQNELKEAET